MTDPSIARSLTRLNPALGIEKGKTAAKKAGIYGDNRVAVVDATIDLAEYS